MDPIHEDAVLKTPPRSKSPEPIIDTGTTQQKKIVLKRKLIIETPTSVNKPNSDDKTIEQSSLLAESTPAKLAKTPITIAALNDKVTESQLTVSSADENKSDDNDADKKSVKLTELSAKERLEMRAKKFGAPVASDAMKLARAERFGITSTSGNTASGDIKNGSEVSVDVLKKRAERFGGSVSKVMNKIENLEKLQKRQQRFGNNTTNKSSGTAVSSSTSKEYEEKARLRLERFNKAAVK